MQDQIIVGSRLKAAGVTLLGCGFVALGVWMVGRPDQSVDKLLIGWLCLGFFGLCTVLGIFQIARPASVALFADRFEIRNGRGKSLAVRWADIQPFFILKIRSTKLVSFNYQEGHLPTKRSPLAKLSSAMGADGSLPNTLSLSADDLLKLMNERREQALKGQRPAKA